MRTFRFALCCFALCVVSASAATITVIETTVGDWAASVSGIFVTEPFDATGLQPFTGVTTVNGSIGPSRGLFPVGESVWNDNVSVDGQEVTTFNFGLGHMLGFAADWDLSPGGLGQGVRIDVVLEDQSVLCLAGADLGCARPEIGPMLDADGNPVLDPFGDPIAFTGFLGFVSDVPMDIVFLSAGTGVGLSESFDIDNLRFGGNDVVNAVPEPYTLFLVGLGLLGVGALRRRCS